MLGIIPKYLTILYYGGPSTDICDLSCESAANTDGSTNTGVFPDEQQKAQLAVNRPCAPSLSLCLSHMSPGSFARRHSEPQV